MLIGDDFSNQLKIFCKEIYNIVYSNSTLLSVDNEKFLFTKNIENKLILYSKTTNNSYNSLLCNLLIDVCKKSIIYGGNKNITAIFITELLKNILKDSNQNIENYCESLKCKIQKNIIFPYNKRIIKKLLLNYTDYNSTNIIFEAYKLSGINGKISIEPGYANDIIIELIEGNSFDLEFPKRFCTNNKQWNYVNVKCLIIDGIIESPSEIHKILEKASETKEPVAIFCYGFGEDVISTLYVNFLRKTLNVIPIVVPKDIENLNIINDIAIVCGTDIISSLKGQLISSVVYEDLSYIDSISCSGNTITITNPRTFNSQVLNYKRLIEEYSSNNILGIKEKSFNKRFKALTSLKTIIHIPNQIKNKSDSLYENTLKGLELYKSLISRGYVKTKLIDEIKNISHEYVPTNFILVAIELGKKFIKDIANSGIMIIDEEI